MHKFQVGQILRAKSSGKLYKVEQLRGENGDNHRMLKGGLGYSVVGQRDGRDFGPWRLMPETSFEPGN